MRRKLGITRSLLAAALAAFCASPCAAGRGLEVSGGPWLPFKIHRAILSSGEGIRGEVRVKGLSWEGGEEELFRAKVEGWTTSCEVAFYLGEGTRGLAFETEGPAGPSRLEIDLAAEAGGAGPPGAAELERRAALRGLPMPAARLHPGFLPGGFRLEASDLAGASLSIGRFLFASTGRLRWGGLALAFLAAAAAALDAARRAKSGRSARTDAAIISIAIIMGTLSLILIPPDSGLVIVDMPAAPIPGGPEGEFRGRREEISGIGVMSYSAAGGDGKTGLVLAGIHAPSGRTVPLGLLEGRAKSGCRFSAPPLVLKAGGEFRVETHGPTLAWLANGD